MATALRALFVCATSVCLLASPLHQRGQKEQVAHDAVSTNHVKVEEIKRYSVPINPGNPRTDHKSSNVVEGSRKLNPAIAETPPDVDPVDVQTAAEADPIDMGTPADAAPTQTDTLTEAQLEDLLSPKKDEGQTTVASLEVLNKEGETDGSGEAEEGESNIAGKTAVPVEDEFFSYGELPYRRKRTSRPARAVTAEDMTGGGAAALLPVPLKRSRRIKRDTRLTRDEMRTLTNALLEEAEREAEEEEEAEYSEYPDEPEYHAPEDEEDEDSRGWTRGDLEDILEQAKRSSPGDDDVEAEDVLGPTETDREQEDVKDKMDFLEYLYGGGGGARDRYRNAYKDAEESWEDVKPEDAPAVPKKYETIIYNGQPGIFIPIYQAQPEKRQYLGLSLVPGQRKRSDDFYPYSDESSDGRWGALVPEQDKRGDVTSREEYRRLYQLARALNRGGEYDDDAF